MCYCFSMKKIKLFPLGTGNFARHAPLLLSLLLACLLLAACDSGDPKPGGQVDPRLAEILAHPGEPVNGGQMRMGSLGEASNLIPYLSSDSASSEITEWLYIAPLRYDKNLEIEAFAAESWEVLDGGRHFRFTLKPGIVWEDGHPLSADDVAFTYQLMIDPKTPTAYAGDFLLIKEFKQTGPLSFEVWYEKPYARAIITWMLPILPKHCLEGQDINNTPFSRQPIGAGAFKLKRWDAGSRITLEANPRYFEGRPRLDEVIYRNIPDLSTIFLEAKAGKLDFLGLTPQQYLRQTKGAQWEAHWRKYKYLSPSYTFLGFNLESPFFKEEKVRQALSHAVNREAIIKVVLLGMGEPTIGPYKPGTWVYNDKLEPYPYDPQKAAALLAEAGWLPSKEGILQKDGLPFDFTILVNQGNDQRIKAATIIQQNLKAVGVNARIRTVEWAAFIKEFVEKGRYDALILAWNILQDPDIYDVWHSSKAVANGLNFIKYRNAEVDELLEAGRSSTNQAERKVAYDRIQAILHKEQPYIFLFVPYALPMVAAKVQNIEPAPAGITYNFDRWWIPKLLQD